MRFCVWGFLLLFAQVSFAANPIATSKSSISSQDNIKKEFSNAFQFGYVLRTLGGNTENAPQDSNVDYKPNVNMGMAVAWSNRALGIALSANVAKVDDKDKEQQKIQTSAEDYQFRYFHENIGLEFIYQRYRGFNLSDHNDKKTVEESAMLLPDMKMSTLQMQVDWAFYGLSALESFGPNWGKPKKDGYAYYVTGGYSHFNISNPTPFLPQNVDFWGDDKGLLSGTYQTLAAGLGASYIWQWTRFYIGILGSIQVGPQLQDYETTTNKDSKTKFVYIPQAKIVLGYDWSDYYTSFIFHSHRVTVNMQDTDFAFFSQDASFNFGVRF